MADSESVGAVSSTDLSNSELFSLVNKIMEQDKAREKLRMASSTQPTSISNNDSFLFNESTDLIESVLNNKELTKAQASTIFTSSQQLDERPFTVDANCLTPSLEERLNPSVNDSNRRKKKKVKGVAKEGKLTASQQRQKIQNETFLRQMKEIRSRNNQRKHNKELESFLNVCVSIWV